MAADLRRWAVQAEARFEALDRKYGAACAATGRQVPAGNVLSLAEWLRRQFQS